MPTAAAERSSLRVGFDGLAAYLSQGYFAVYLSLQEPFVPGYGVGNSVFLQRQAARVFGEDRVLGRSYPDRIQARGWNAYGYWATIYPWIASDVTFPGTVLVMGLIGWLTARVWTDLLGGSNPLAVALFGQLLVLLYYVPGHNKLMHSGESAIGFLALLLAWGVTRRSGAANAGVRRDGVDAPARSDAVLAVVGSLVPDEPRFHGPAFNRASQMFQDELVRGLAVAGLDVDRVFSMEPLPGFPRGRRILAMSATATTRSGLRVRLLPYVNVPVIKAVTVGLSAFVALVGWAWRQRHRPRIMHVFNLMMPPGGAVWLAARLTGSRVTVSVLDVWRPGALVPDTWAWRADFRMQQMLMPRFDGHMVVTPAIRDDLLPGRRVCVLEGGIAPDRFPTSTLDTAHSPRLPGTFRLVLSGSLEAFNGVELALEALARLPGDVELVIAGSGRLADVIRDRANRDPRVTFAGFLPFEEVLSLYYTADLLLNIRITRDIDTRYFFPSKLMELLASGVPVLSTCTGPVEIEYGDVAYLLRDETPDGLAARIMEIRAIDPDERRQRGARAREYMFAEKTWERQARRLAQYLRKEVVETLPV